MHVGIFLIGAWMILISTLSTFMHPLEEGESRIEALLSGMVLLGTFLLGFGLAGMIH